MPQREINRETYFAFSAPPMNADGTLDVSAFPQGWTLAQNVRSWRTEHANAPLDSTPFGQTLVELSLGNATQTVTLEMTWERGNALANRLLTDVNKSVYAPQSIEPIWILQVHASDPRGIVYSYFTAGCYIFSPKHFTGVDGVMVIQASGQAEYRRNHYFPETRIGGAAPTPPPALPLPQTPEFITSANTSAAFVEISGDSEIYATTDGSDPRTSATRILYSASALPLTVGEPLTVNAVGYRADFSTYSPVISRTFTRADAAANADCDEMFGGGDDCDEMFGGGKNCDEMGLS
jgi:hypothetical protein